jgi:hypothetical protein
MRGFIGLIRGWVWMGGARPLVLKVLVDFVIVFIFFIPWVSGMILVGRGAVRPLVLEVLVDFIIVFIPSMRVMLVGGGAVRPLVLEVHVDFLLVIFPRVGEIRVRVKR